MTAPGVAAVEHNDQVARVIQPRRPPCKACRMNGSNSTVGMPLNIHPDAAARHSTAVDPRAHRRLFGPTLTLESVKESLQQQDQWFEKGLLEAQQCNQTTILLTGMELQTFEALREVREGTAKLVDTHSKRFQCEILKWLVGSSILAIVHLKLPFLG